MIDHGADVNAQDCIGNTPLHLACISGRVGIVGVLLRAGANLSPTECRSTPLSLALGRLQSMMNEKRTISSSTAKAEILDVKLKKIKTFCFFCEFRFVFILFFLIGFEARCFSTAKRCVGIYIDPMIE